MRFFLTVLLLIFGCLLASPSIAQSQSAKIKAVFLFKFFDYTSWHSDKDPKQTKRGIVCTYGPHPFKNALHYIADKKSKSVKYETKEIDTPDQAKFCHIVFIARGHIGDVSAFNRTNALVVSDSGGTNQKGGTIEMRSQGGKVKLLIDLNNARAQNIKLSSRLLKIAEVSK